MFGEIIMNLYEKKQKHTYNKYESATSGDNCQVFNNAAVALRYFTTTEISHPAKRESKVMLKVRKMMSKLATARERLKGKPSQSI